VAVADWDSGMSACCTADPVVRYQLVDMCYYSSCQRAAVSKIVDHESRLMYAVL